MSSLDRAIETEIKLTFESKSIVEVRKVEAATRSQVDAKKQGLFCRSTFYSFILIEFILKTILLYNFFK